MFHYNILSRYAERLSSYHHIIFLVTASEFVKTCSFIFVILASDSCHQQDMPAAEGAVAAAAVADQMYGPKEDRKLTIVLVIFIHLQMLIYLVVITHSLDYLTCSYMSIYCFHRFIISVQIVEI